MQNLKKTLHNILHEKYGFKDFRPGQEETLLSIFHHQFTFAILPTGAGKSLLYQMPAYLTSGVIVVVSPLISLMQDQIDRLRKQGSFPVAMLNSRLNYQQQKQILRHIHKYRFIFTSPETLVKKDVLHTLQQAAVSLFVVDEAHCISQWGPNFRPEYLLLKEALRIINPKRTLLLTATATPEVATDVVKKLGLIQSSVKVIRQPVNRNNIFLAVKNVANEHDKQHSLIQLLHQLGPGGVIYFSSKKIATEISALIQQHIDLRVGLYHADLTSIERFQVQQQFMHNQLDVICATSAFGMGINKNDIRYVIHYHLPGSLESYVQEIGRAGRDNHQAVAILLYAAGDEYLPELLGQIELPSPQILQAIKNHTVSNSVLGDYAELFNFYLQHNFSVNKIQQIIRQQNQQSQLRLQAMLSYVRSTGCRRDQINSYFKERTTEKPQWCCDNDQPDWKITALKLPRQQVVDRSKVEDWHEIINNLFNLS